MMNNEMMNNELNLEELNEVAGGAKCKRCGSANIVAWGTVGSGIGTAVSPFFGTIGGAALGTAVGVVDSLFGTCRH